MSWSLTSLRSAAADARRRVDAEARAAIDSAKGAARAAKERAKEAVRTVAQRAPEPSAAITEHATQAARDFVKNAAAKATARIPSSSPLPGPLPSPTTTPSLVPGVNQEGSAAEKVRPYVMLGAGFGTGVVSGHLGPGGAIAQRGLDAVVDHYGTAQDKFNFGYGQMASAAVVGAEGATIAGGGGTVEVGSAGAASPVAIPAVAYGAVEIGVAISHADGASALMSRGSPGRPSPAPTTSSPGGTPQRVYEGSPKHGAVKVGNVSPAPKNGQAALDNSTQVKDTSTRRVGVDRSTGEIVVFDETHNGKGIFHGHVRSWDELSNEQRNACVRAGLTDRRGRILGGTR